MKKDFIIMTDSQDCGMATDKARKLKSFYIHLLVFVLVNAGLLAMNSIRQPDKMWSYWVFLGWGAGILLHATKVFSCSVCNKWWRRKNNTLVKGANSEVSTQPQPSSITK